MERRQRGTQDRISGAGFTMLELMLVVVILGVVGVLVVPRLAGALASARVGKGSERVFAAAREAQSRAVLRGVRTRFVLVFEEGTFWIEEERRPLESPGLWAELPGFEEKPCRLDDGVRFAELIRNEESLKSGRVEIGFRPDGSADDARIFLENDVEDRGAVEIRGLTGRVRILTPEEMATGAASPSRPAMPKFQTGNLKGSSPSRTGTQLK
jgi:prepilin-type N-terminal cleavage/methylation domain-containing protein